MDPRFKTRPCRNWEAAKGRCPYGAKCLFIHPTDVEAWLLPAYKWPDTWPPRSADDQIVANLRRVEAQLLRLMQDDD